MSNMQTVPFVDHQTLAPALTALAGSFVYDMKGIDRASLQLNTVFSNAGDTDVVTLSISNDGVNYSPFSTAKTITFTGGTTDTGLFELGSIDYVFLRVNWAATSAHTFTLVGYLYGTGNPQTW
jgi:hypothetical protein